jgi:LCP family protein required for cell wall assembly
VTGLLRTVVVNRFQSAREAATSTTSQSDQVTAATDGVEPGPSASSSPDDTGSDEGGSGGAAGAPVTVAEPPAGTVAPDGEVEPAEETGSGEVADTPAEPPAPPPVEGPEAEPSPPGRRTPRWAVALIAVGTVIVLLAAGTYATAASLVHRYDQALPKAPLLDPSARAQPANAGHLTITGPLNFLMLGSDARPNDTVDGQRSDTIIILHIPATMDRAYLVSVPRDLLVHIPPDPDTGFSGSHEKINGAFNYGGGGIGGFQLVSKTLTDLTGLKFDGAAIVDFVGFQSVVRLLGGVNMCVDQETKSIHTKAVYEPGCQHLAPWQALDYVRQRELLPNGDYDRQRHQQQFLRAILQEARDQGLDRNPVKLDQFIRSVEGSLVVDTNGVPVAELAFALRGITPSTVVGVRLPSHPEMIGGISYVLADEEAPSLYQAIVADTLDDWVTAHPEWVNPI